MSRFRPLPGPVPRRLLSLLLLTVLLVALLAGLSERPAQALRPGAGTPDHPAPETSYALAQRAPFNRPDHYPLDRRPDPSLFRPHAEWMGRLILPTPAELSQASPVSGSDWTWIELEQVPRERSQLLGRRLRLSWQATPELMGLVRTVTTDIHLGEEARRVAANGNVVPTRLDGRRAVGPLQSLAGARPRDDVSVQLEQVRVEEGTGDPVLRIGRSPVQITGRWSALVKILGPESTSPDGDRFRVRHFDPDSGGFDGPIQSLRIPVQPPDRFGRRFFDPRGINTSPVGEAGWYVHGSPDATGLFTVQALEPRRLTQLRADSTVRGTAPGLRHILHQNWRDTPARRGRISRDSLWPDNARSRLLSARGTATGRWKVGDQALVIHGFGGIGGPDGERTPGFTVTGHFSFGQADVITDPFTGEPRFAIRYHQIYANNPNGIVAGSQDWSAFSGDLQRGWLGTRPISDVLIEGDEPLLRELAIQAAVMMARYRTGDGDGVSSVTPATSCVQDSSQALFISIDQLRRRAAAIPEVAAAVAAGGEDADRLHRLASLTRALEDLLTPFGMVRSDWRRNASLVEAAAAAPVVGDSRSIGASDGFLRGSGLLDGIQSWRSMIPRRAMDDMAKVFLRHGSPLWILRTNQIPGKDPRLEPLAPTLLLGQLPLLSTLLRRFSDALFTPLTPRAVALSLALLGTYGALVLPAGFRSGFLQRRTHPSPPATLMGRAAGLLVLPALIEELVFRVGLLPHPLEGVGLASALAWGALSLGLFVAYHPLAARLWYPQGRHTFSDPRFLVPCALLGVICSIAYAATGSVWPPVLIHWLVVLVWVELLGGSHQLRARESQG